MSPFNLADYEPVEDRLAKFWVDHPTGRITTDMVHVGADGYIVKASVWRQTGIHVLDFKSQADPLKAAWISHPETSPDATGYAQEAVTERGVNSTSALENCETSAIGRALANLGYAAKGKRASREEMSKASAETTDAVSSPASGKQAPSEPTPPASAEGGPTPGTTPATGAPPNLSPSETAPADSGGDSSSAAPVGAGTEAGGARQEPAGHGEGPAGSEGSPQPPNTRRDQLWKQLVEFAGGSEAKARTEINSRLKTGWTKGNTEHIPEDDIENTLKALLQEQGVV